MVEEAVESEPEESEEDEEDREEHDPKESFTGLMMGFSMKKKPAGGAASKAMLDPVTEEV